MIPSGCGIQEQRGPRYVMGRGGVVKHVAEQAHGTAMYGRSAWVVAAQRRAMAGEQVANMPYGEAIFTQRPPLGLSRRCWTKYTNNQALCLFLVRRPTEPLG